MKQSVLVNLRLKIANSSALLRIRRWTLSRSRMFFQKTHKAWSSSQSRKARNGRACQPHEPNPWGLNWYYARGMLKHNGALNFSKSDFKDNIFALNALFPAFRANAIVNGASAVKKIFNLPPIFWSSLLISGLYNRLHGSITIWFQWLIGWV